MGFINSIKEWLKEGQKELKALQEKKYWERVESTANDLNRISLSCKRCNTLSVPVFGTESHYCCLKCGNRFISKKHEFALKYDNSADRYVYRCPHYNDSIEYMKKYHLK
ncbi:hypothetical protein FHP22_15740 (plasmid) [Acinetobacter indicus]|uniref:hypothetical protein n=1 Tax=Acinetobacter indicus TaxID=756892 RepID=UPI0012663BBB|nr:hypothetical protein [Acinetobacter indicus]QFS18894.1 hypothetical protein FHP22_15740 [Acinetobacter indicus]